MNNPVILSVIQFHRQNIDSVSVNWLPTIRTGRHS